MAQLVSILFFSVALIAGVAMIVAMLHGEWDRIRAVLNGEMLDQANAQSRPQVRVRLRSWNRAEARRALPTLRAAA